MDTIMIGYNSTNKERSAKTRGLKKRLFKRMPLRMLAAEDRELLRSALEARDDWIAANNNYDYVYDEMLVDYYTFKIKACEIRYTYFLRLAKEKGLTRYITMPPSAFSGHISEVGEGGLTFHNIR